MEIIQGTTPNIELAFPAYTKVSEFTEATVYIKQGGTCLTKHLKDVVIDPDNNLVIVPMTAQETMMFSASVIEIQMFYKKNGDDSIYGTHRHPIRIYPKEKFADMLFEDVEKDSDVSEDTDKDIKSTDSKEGV